MVIMFHAHKNERMMEYIELAHGIMSNSITNTRSLLARQLFEGTSTVPRHPLKKGIEYADYVKSSRLGPKIKLAAAAEKRLQEAGNKGAGRLSIGNFTNIVIEAAILDNTSVRSLAPIEKARTGPFMLISAMNRQRKPLTRFDWLSNVYLRFEGDADEELDHGEVAWFAHPNIRSAFNTIGIASGAKIRFSPGSILRILRKDKKFPRYINEEHIVNELQRINVLFDHDQLSDILISFGAAPAQVAEVIEVVASSLDKFALLQASGSISLTDDVFSTLDTSSSRLTEFTYGTTGVVDLDSLILLLIAGIQVVDLPYRKWQNMSFALGLGGLAAIRSQIYTSRLVEEDWDFVYATELVDPISEGFF
jgi:hypothetical protein